MLPAVAHPYGKQLPDFSPEKLWCEAAFAGLPYVTIRNDEQRNRNGRTWDLIELLRHDHPNCNFAWIGGNDIADDMRNWYRGEELCATLQLLPVPRGGFGDMIALP